MFKEEMKICLLDSNYWSDSLTFIKCGCGIMFHVLVELIYSIYMAYIFFLQSFILFWGQIEKNNFFL